MKQVTYFSEEPEKVRVESGTAPNRKNRCWIRQNIRKEQKADEESSEELYASDEVYFETDAPVEKILADPDSYVPQGGEWEESMRNDPSIDERVSAAEQALIELMMRG